MQPILEMKNITKKFPGVTALENVTFSACPGEILALCGENGAGKSTLMKILSGSYPSNEYSGEIIINGKAAAFQSTHQSEQAGIAMIYQEISMHLDMTVAENIFLGRWPLRGGVIDWMKLEKDAVPFLEMVQLDISPRVTLRNLSTSQQQLVSIARALSKQPRILVLDEPTSPLTNRESDNLFQILSDLKSKSIACIIISHKLDEVFKNADRITVLRDGQVISTVDAKNVDPSQVVTDMVGRTITSYYPKETVAIGEIMLEAKGFTVPHPYTAGKNIINNASFSVRKGEVLGIAGLVGSGRSELVNAIFGTMRKSAGEVSIEGNKIDINNARDAILNGIALVTEDRKANGVIGILSILENESLVSLYKFNRGGVLNLKKIQTISQEYFNKLGVKAPSVKTLVQTLSGGNQQKVVLAKWLMNQPKVLILDEPTRGIDIGAKFEIYKIMMELVRSGMSIIMISSELPELLHMSDRILVLANGNIEAELDAKKCTQQMIMEVATSALEAGSSCNNQ